IGPVTREECRAVLSCVSADDGAPSKAYKRDGRLENGRFVTICSLTQMSVSRPLKQFVWVRTATGVATQPVRMVCTLRSFDPTPCRAYRLIRQEPDPCWEDT